MSALDVLYGARALTQRELRVARAPDCYNVLARMLEENTDELRLTHYARIARICVEQEFRVQNTEQRLAQAASDESVSLGLERRTAAEQALAHDEVTQWWTQLRDGATQQTPLNRRLTVFYAAAISQRMRAILLRRDAPERWPDDCAMCRHRADNVLSRLSEVFDRFLGRHIDGEAALGEIASLYATGLWSAEAEHVRSTVLQRAK